MPHKPYFRFLRSSHGRGEGGGSAVGRVHGWLRPPDPLADAGMSMSDEAANWRREAARDGVFKIQYLCCASG